MKELSKEQVLTNMMESSSALSIKIWELHKRISGEYKSSYDALKDMVKLGEMAQALINIREVEKTISKHL